MQAGYDRFAVYWVPPASDPLAEFGTRWTGWCPEAGEKRQRIASPLEGLDLRPITRETCRHGFHGVLKGLFRMSDERRFWALQRKLCLLADDLREVRLPRLAVGVADGRVALVPERRCEALDDLACRVRAAVAPFERPEVMQRDPAQFVVDGVADDADVPVRPADSFHMPLTDRLTVQTARQLAVRLRPFVRDRLGQAHVLADIALVADPGDGRRVRVEEHFPLSDRIGFSGSDSFACRGPRVYAPLPEPVRVAAPAA